jgi:hypothetical protein
MRLDSQGTIVLNLNNPLKKSGTASHSRSWSGNRLIAAQVWGKCFITEGALMRFGGKGVSAGSTAMAQRGGYHALLTSITA